MLGNIEADDQGNVLLKAKGLNLMDSMGKNITLGFKFTLEGKIPMGVRELKIDH